MDIKDIFKPPLSLLITAKRLSGKTYFLSKLLKKIRSNFDEIYIFKGSPDNSLDSLEKYDNIIVLDFDLERVNKLYNNIKKQEKKVNVLLLFDDIINFVNLSKKSIFSELSFKGRHYSVSYALTTQQLKSVSPLIRNNSLQRIYFRSSNMKELDMIAEENETVDLNFDKTKKLIQETTKGYNYLLVEDTVERKFFKGNLTELTEINL